MQSKSVKEGNSWTGIFGWARKTVHRNPSVLEGPEFNTSVPLEAKAVKTKTVAGASHTVTAVDLELLRIIDPVAVPCPELVLRVFTLGVIGAVGRARRAIGLSKKKVNQY